MDATPGNQQWLVANTDTGRPYYYISGSSQTTWNKPDALLTPNQLATGWTETTTGPPDQKPYWFLKSDTNQTSWTPPEGWLEPQ